MILFIHIHKENAAYTNFGGNPLLACKRYYRIVGFTLFAKTLTVGLLVIAWLQVGRYNNVTRHHLPEARNREF